ncbi:T9SS sorting signal type C domain-containing protein [uncultured Flavobacterium sp.]|uniref:T9SS sorting signal type C domain-containing protein n=1 Tax=uncultured Flavobacterium sp. TaxID=165435 RepID=UPI0030EE121A|tara:strand:+ start:2695 stop:5301 length:2607 start_codon:yes stop_codon:yes gene_type:complete
MIKNLLFLLILIPVFSFGQSASNYCFTASAGTYSSLTGGTNTSLGSTDDDVLSSAVTLPFSFVFAGTSYSQIKVCSNGWLTFGTTTNTHYSNTLANANTINPVLMPLWDDLKNSVTPRYLISGVSPNRIFKLEWSQQKWNYNSSSDVISFQVWLYESTNVVEYIYKNGVSPIANGNGRNDTAGATIGVYDAAGTYLTLNNSGTSPAAQSGTFTTNILTKPAEGQIYRFTPQIPAPVSAVGTAINCSGATANWSAAAGATGYLLDVSTVNTFASFVSGYNGLNVGNVAAYALSGLVAGTTYYYRVRANSTCTVNSATQNFTTLAATSTIWNGTAWSNGTPTNAKRIEFTGNYSSSSDLVGCSCKVTSGNVVINNGNSISLTNELTIAGGALVFENSGNLIQLNNTIANSGNITVKRNSSPIVLDDFTYWSSPTTGTQTLLNFSPLTQGDKFFDYNNYWVSIGASTRVFSAGIGYAIRAPEGISPSSPTVNTSFNFVGVPNNGTINIPVTIRTSGPDINTGERLIGNPYPSAIDAVEFINANFIGYGTINKTFGGELYFWTHNNRISANNYASTDYAVYNLSGGIAAGGASGTGNLTAPSRYITSGQGFFIEAFATGNVTFTNNMRVGGNNANFYKMTSTKETSEESSRIWLNLTNNTQNFSQTLVGYIPNATNEFNPGYDSRVYDVNQPFALYSLLGSDKLSIQGRALPFIDTDLVPLGYAVNSVGNATITIDHVDGLFFAGQKIYLEDKLLNVVHDIKATPYNFSTSAGTFNDRFVLRYTNKSLGIKDFNTLNNQVLVSIKNKQLKVSSTIELIDEITIFEITGKEVFQKKNVDSQELMILNMKPSQHLLLVKVMLQNGEVVIKKAIN